MPIADKLELLKAVENGLGDGLRAATPRADRTSSPPPKTATRKNRQPDRRKI